MAEWSKAPDSRLTLLSDRLRKWEFWSSYEGVGSNPTSDKVFNILRASIIVAQFNNTFVDLGL